MKSKCPFCYSSNSKALRRPELGSGDTNGTKLNLCPRGVRTAAGEESQTRKTSVSMGVGSHATCEGEWRGEGLGMLVLDSMARIGQSEMVLSQGKKQ